MTSNINQNEDEIKAEISRLTLLLQEKEALKREADTAAALVATKAKEEEEAKTPDVYADYNKEHTVIVFNMKSDVPTHIFYSNESIGFHRGYNKYVLNVANLSALDLFITNFNKRYPNKKFILSAELEAELKTEIDKRNELISILDSDGAGLLPYKLNGYDLKLEQAKSIEFLKHNDGNGIIALKMGKGKTPVGLGYMKWYWDNIDPKQKFLIISPATLRPNWIREVKKFLGDTEQVYPLTGTTPQSIDVQHLITKDEYRVFYVNYDLLSRGLKLKEAQGVERTIFPWAAILSIANLRLILDEAHYIKNPAAARSQVIDLCKFKSSVLLSGTPMKNGPGELYTLVRQLKPDFAGSYQGWLNTYTLNNGRVSRNPELLRSILQSLMYRPKTYSDDVGLQPINRITIEYELSDNAKKLYNQVLMGFYDDLAKWDGSTNNSQLVTNMLVEMMRMKQVCAADKIDFIAERAIDTYDSCEPDDKHKKVIIFSQFANEPPIVERIARLLGDEAVMFTGNNDVSERQQIVDRFQTDDKIHFLCCSTKAASEGLTITAAGHIIFCDLMWTPSDHSQAEGRAYNRINDPHTITSTYVVASDTIEDHIVGILTRKLGEINKVVDGNDMSGESIVRELLGELRNMRMLK